MQNMKQSFINQALVFGSDGAMSYEPERALHNGAALAEAAQELFHQTQHLDFSHIIAQGQGAAPLAAALAMMCSASGRDVPILQLKSAKRYPERKQLMSGQRPPAGAKVLIVDDCILKGASARETLRQLTEANLAVQIAGIAVYYDDKQLGGSRQIEASGIPVFSCINRLQIGLTRRAAKDKPILGKMLWQRHGFQLHRGRACAPAIHEGAVIVADDSCRLWSIDLATGDDRWISEPTVEHKKGINNDLQCIMNGHLAYGSYSGELTRIDLATGQIIWRVKAAYALHSSPIFVPVRKWLLQACESWNTADNKPAGHLKAFDWETGVEIWSAPLGHFSPCEAAHNGNLAFATANDQTLNAFDLATGELMWQANTRGLVRGRIMAGKRKVITMSEQGWAQAWHAEGGGLLWERRLGRTSNHVSPEAFSGITVSADSRLYGLNDQGDIRWASRLRSHSAWRPARRAAIGQCFLTASMGGHLAAFDWDGIKQREQKTPQLKCFAPPAIGQIDGQEVAAFLTLDGRLATYTLES